MRVNVFYKAGGQDNAVARSAKNHEVFYFSTASRDAHIFTSLETAVDTVEKKFSAYEPERFIFKADDRKEDFSGWYNGLKSAKAAIIRVDNLADTSRIVNEAFSNRESEEDFKKRVETNKDQTSDVSVRLWNNIVDSVGRHDLKIEVDQEAAKGAQEKIVYSGTATLKPYQEEMMKATNKLHAGGHGARAKNKTHVHIRGVGKVPITEAVQTGYGSRFTNDEAVAQVASYYGLDVAAVHTALQKAITGTTNEAVDDMEEVIDISRIDDEFCIQMSDKIKTFIMDDSRRSIIGISSIEKAAGIPTSTISNYISAKRDRIPLHHIGPIVKVLKAIGF